MSELRGVGRCAKCVQVRLVSSRELFRARVHPGKTGDGPVFLPRFPRSAGTMYPAAGNAGPDQTRLTRRKYLVSSPLISPLPSPFQRAPWSAMSLQVSSGIGAAALFGVVGAAPSDWAGCQQIVGRWRAIVQCSAALFVQVPGYCEMPAQGRPDSPG